MQWINKGVYLEKKIEYIINRNKKIVMEKRWEAFGPLMGIIMKKMRGRVNAETVSEIIRKKIEIIIKWSSALLVKNNVFATYTHLHAAGTRLWAKYLINTARINNFTRKKLWKLIYKFAFMKEKSYGCNYYI